MNLHKLHFTNLPKLFLTSREPEQDKFRAHGPRAKESEAQAQEDRQPSKVTISSNKKRDSFTF